MQKGQRMKIPNDENEYRLWEMNLKGSGASFNAIPLNPNDEITYEETRMSFGSDGMPEDIFCITKNGKRHCGTIDRKKKKN